MAGEGGDMTPGFLAEQRLCAGSLGAHVALFAAVLADFGYATTTTEEKVRLVASFGRWLGRRRLDVAQIDERRAAEFLAYRRRLGRTSRSHQSHQATVRVLLDVLRKIGVVQPASTDESQANKSPFADLLRLFTRHLVEERGLGASTCANYVPVVGRMLSGRFRDGPVELDKLRPEDVGRFVVREARRTSAGRMKVVVPALRVFLRWLHQRGETDTNLTGCVPAVADWRLATVPKSMPPDQVERLLRHCDRATAAGRRDYAILLLLARLGLRAGEVVAMDLDDLDWERAELVVRGKGGRQDRFPVPREVGAAVAAYLRHGRPTCSTRRVFVRARAPRRGFVDATAITDIVHRGLKRAGLDPPRKGAHSLRHALACTMLRRGASLAQIGQILRHRSPDTTALYAKVDVASLRALAPPWPSVGR